MQRVEVSFLAKMVVSCPESCLVKYVVTAVNRQNRRVLIVLVVTVTPGILHWALALWQVRMNKLTFGCSNSIVLNDSVLSSAGSCNSVLV